MVLILSASFTFSVSRARKNAFPTPTASRSVRSVSTDRRWPGIMTPASARGDRAFHANDPKYRQHGGKRCPRLNGPMLRRVTLSQCTPGLKCLPAERPRSLASTLVPSPYRNYKVRSITGHSGHTENLTIPPHCECPSASRTRPLNDVSLLHRVLRPHRSIPRQVHAGAEVSPSGRPRSLASTLVPSS